MTAAQPIAFFPAVANFVGGKDTPRDLLERCLVINLPPRHLKSLMASIALSRLVSRA